MKGIEQFHEERGLRLPILADDTTLRTILQPYVDAYRMAVREVWLQDGEPVSSGRVRAALTDGNVAAAASLLGRHYRLRGSVGAGARRGQGLGFPTANLDRPLTLVPGDGVYAARANLDDGADWPAAVNIGPNPTFGENVRKLRRAKGWSQDVPLGRLKIRLSL